MKTTLLRSLIVLSGALLMLGTAGITGPAQAATNVGGLDLNKWCVANGLNHATTIGTTAYDWRCVDRNGALVGINIPSACHLQQGSDTVDRVADFHNVNSWQCWRVSSLTSVGGLDLDAYCRSIGFANATAVGSTAYDWRCVNFGGALGGIDMTRACRAQHGGAAVDRFDNFYDRNSWGCWA